MWTSVPFHSVPDLQMLMFTIRIILIGVIIITIIRIVLFSVTINIFSGSLD